MKKLLLSFTLLTGLAQAGTAVGVNLNSEDVEAKAIFGLNDFMGYNDGVDFMTSGTYLYHSLDNDDSTYLASLSFYAQNALSAAPGLILGLGFKTVFSEDFMAVPLFGQVRYILPLDSDIPTTSLFAKYAYAPELLSFYDAQNYSELRFEADMEVISNIHLFAGYRNIDTDYTDVSLKFNDSFYGGFQFNF